jgi:hypothetical protein
MLFVMLGFVMVVVIMLMVMTEVDVKFDAADLGFLTAGNVRVPAFEAKFFQFSLESAGVNAKVEQRPNEHIAADAAEDVEIEGFHPL